MQIACSRMQVLKSFANMQIPKWGLQGFGRKRPHLDCSFLFQYISVYATTQSDKFTLLVKWGWLACENVTVQSDFVSG